MLELDRKTADSSFLAVNNGLVNLSPALNCSSHARFVCGFSVRALLKKTNELASLCIHESSIVSITVLFSASDARIA